MNMQNVAKLNIPEGGVRTIHDKNGNLIWGEVSYDVKYKGDTAQNGTPTPSAPVAVQTVTGEQTISINGAAHTVNLGSIELCKIGAYQDYIYKSGDRWYVHKEIGESTLSAEGYTKWMTHPDACIYYRNSIPSSALFGDYGNTMACQYYETVGQVADVTTFYNNTTSKSYAMSLKFGTAGIAIKDTRFTTAAQLHTWLAENPTVIYYALATPIDTEITNQALMAQLNAVEQFLTRYGYNATVSGNLPIIIDRTAL